MSENAFFKPIDPENPVNTMSSMCESCGGTGMTNLMMTAIPFFKEVILSSFTCDACGYKSTEVTFGGKLADFGVRMNCKIVSPAHLNRLIVKSEYASIKIPELNVDIPPRTQRGTMNSVEGILSKMAEGLSEGQEDRKTADPESYKKIEEFLANVKKYSTGEKLPFTILIDDPSGNSYIQNPYAPNSDPYNTIEYYVRTKTQLEEMGYAIEDVEDVKEGDTTLKADNPEVEKTKAEAEVAMSKLGVAKKDEKLGVSGPEEAKVHGEKGQQLKRYKYSEAEYKALTERLQKFQKKLQPPSVYEGKISAMGVDFAKPLTENTGPESEAMEFDTPCYACPGMGKNRMCICSIPHFKEIIVMCFECNSCGYRTVEVKGGGGISEKARKLVLKVKTVEDLSRDLYKSDTCSLTIPEIGVEVDSGTMGSVYTTVEGLLEQLHQNLKESNPFGVGDSAENQKYKHFLERLHELKKAPNFTIILDDPAANSFIYSSLYPNPDPQIEAVDYDRTLEQNDELGISDMKVDQ